MIAGNKAFSQYQTVLNSVPTDCLTPHELSGCTDDELHPVQGEVYTYTVNTTDATDDVRWFVINNNDLKSATPVDSLLSITNGILPSGSGYIDETDGTGDYILNLGPDNNTYNADPVSGDGVGADHSIQIAWKYFDGLLPNEVLLVAYVQSNDACTNNIAVYRIIPEPAFTIDIAVLSDDGDSIAAPGTTVVGECVSPIESTVYDGAATTPANMLTVDYGENWAFFIVNGANYKDSWMPTFQISYDGGYSALEASWAYSSDAANAAATWYTIDVASGTTSDPVIAGGTANSAGDGALPAPGGECIVVRVRIDYGTGVEHDLSNSTLSFAVTGTAYDSDDDGGTGSFYDDSAFDDLHYADCQPDGFTNDAVDYLITPRPEAIGVAPVSEEKTGDGTN